MKFKLFVILLLSFFTLFSQNKEAEKFVEYLSDAQIMLLQDNADSAKFLLFKAQELNPQSAAVAYLLSKIYFSTGSNSFALTYAQQAVDLQPDNQWYQRNLFEITVANHLYEKAENLLDNLLKSGNEYDFQLAIKFYSELDDNANLSRVLNSYFSKFGIDRQFLSMYIHSLLYIKDTISALRFARLNLQTNADLSAFAQIITLYQSSNNYDSAFYYLAQAQKLFSDNAEFYALKATFYADYFRIANDTVCLDSSYNSFRTAINMNLDVPTAENFVTSNILLFGINFLQDSLSFFADLIYQKYSTNFLIINKLAEYTYKNNFFFDAIFYYQQSITIKPSNFDDYIHLANLYIRFSEWNKLDTLTSNATLLFPLQPYIYLFRAIALLNLDDLSSALKFLELGRSYVIGNDDLLAYFDFFTAQYYLLVNDKNNYNFYLDNAISKADGNCNILSFFAFYSAKVNDIKQAMNLISFCLMKTPDNLDANFSYIYAYILYKSEDYKLALENISEAISNSNNKNFLFFQLKALIYSELGQEQNAKLFFQLSQRYGNYKNYSD